MQGSNTVNDPHNERAKDSSIEELRLEAEEQRARVAQDLDTLGRKISPQNMKREAKEAVREAGHQAVSTIRHGMDEAAEVGQRAGKSALHFVRDNSVPLALIGIGVGMLFYSSRPRQSASSSRLQGSRRRGVVGRAEEMRGKLEQTARDKQRQAKQAVGEWTSTAADYTRHAKREAVSFYDHNPLAVAGATLVAGAALGLTLPRSAKEDALLGPPREALANKVKEYAEQGLDSAQEAARQATSRAAEKVTHSAEGR